MDVHSINPNSQYGYFCLYTALRYEYLPTLITSYHKAVVVFVIVIDVISEEIFKSVLD